MVSRPQDWIPIFSQAGADTITIHIESAHPIHRYIESIKKFGRKAGVSFNPGNPVSFIEELLDWVDVVQVMSVDPGFSGQDFISNALRKVRHLADLRKARKYLIEVDGGIDMENIASIREAGADVFVLGSYIFSRPDRGACIAKLREQLK